MEAKGLSNLFVYSPAEELYPFLNILYQRWYASAPRNSQVNAGSAACHNQEATKQWTFIRHCAPRLNEGRALA